MENISQELREKCYRICADYLGGVWRTFSGKDILIEKFIGGYVNLTMKVSLPPGVESIGNEPTQVVIKLDQGLVEGGNNFRRMTENIIAVILAERGLAPKVYGILEDGRLDEYIVSRTLVVKDLENPQIVEALCKKLAHLHSQNIPISKDSNRTVYFGKMHLEVVLNDPRNKLDDPKRNQLLKKLHALSPREEFGWLTKLIQSVNAPVVYCHGDFQLNNILLPSGFPDESLYIIDFDGSAYSFRGTDFASIFNSFCMILPYPEHPYVKLDWNNFPSINMQKYIIRLYLEEYQKINKINFNLEEEETQILRESEVFLLVYYFFMFMYCLSRNDTNKPVNKLDWLYLGDIILKRYQELKDKFISNIS